MSGVPAGHLRAELRGLPGGLPRGESLLWQGAPVAGAFLRRVLHLRVVAAYFLAVLALSALSSWSQGATAHQLALGLARRGALAAVPLALMAAYAWAVARTTIYTITSKRIVVGCGIALPMSFNLPFAQIKSAGLCLSAGRSGDVVVKMYASEKLSYFALWPHVRPWRIAHAEPMLRCLKDGQAASAVLADALRQYGRDAAPHAERRPDMSEQHEPAVRFGEPVAA